MKKYYIAYGSNLNVGQMRYRCPGARIAGIGCINDYELKFKGSKTGSYLTIEPCAGKKVPVGVWEVNPSDEANLDRYEGFPNFYYKKEVEIEIESMIGKRTKNVKAFVYIMHENRKHAMPSGMYVDTCKEGYDDFGFDKNYLREALRTTMKGMMIDEL